MPWLRVLRLLGHGWEAAKWAFMRPWGGFFMRTHRYLVSSLYLFLLPCLTAQTRSAPPPPAPPHFLSTKTDVAFETYGNAEVRTKLSAEDLKLLNQFLPKDIDKVKKRWYRLVPQEARPPENRKGLVYVRFVIHRNGTVSDLNTVYSSGDAAMVAAAWNGIQKAAPFRHFPRHFKGKEIRLQFNFAYNMTPPVKVPPYK